MHPSAVAGGGRPPGRSVGPRTIIMILQVDINTQSHTDCTANHLQAPSWTNHHKTDKTIADMPGRQWTTLSARWRLWPISSRAPDTAPTALPTGTCTGSCTRTGSGIGTCSECNDNTNKAAGPRAASAAVTRSPGCCHHSGRSAHAPSAFSTQYIFAPPTGRAGH